MTQDEYEKLRVESGAINLAHPEIDRQYHKDYLSDVTIIIPQRQTKIATQLCVESLLRFYPDIKIVLIDGDSQDSSSLYCQYKALTNSNITYYNYIGRNSHGEIIDFAFREIVHTEFALTMDSDTITNRGGWIEGMLKQFDENPKLYATGSLMLVTYKNEACGFPESQEDVLRYAHPSCSIYHVPTYFDIEQPCTDHGAAFALNMIKARDMGIEVGAFPIDKYVSHRTGTSWVKEHKIVWADDYGVFLRPFITFLLDTTNQINQLQLQSEKDFNIVTLGDNHGYRIWETTTRDIDNKYFDIRFAVNGEYVIRLKGDDVLNPDFVSDFKKYIIECKTPESGTAMGVEFWKREYFQNQISLF